MEWSTNENSHQPNNPKSNALHCKEQKRQTSQPLRRASLVDILLKRIQPSLFERKWIIEQRQNFVGRPKLYVVKGRKDGSESRIKELAKTKFCKNDEDKQRNKSRMKWREMTERKEKFMENSKRKENSMWSKTSKLLNKRKCKMHDLRYEVDIERHSIHSTDSEVCLAGLRIQ